ncbi:MAG: hypothetical protein JNL87_03460 [Burkholderiaceae bacterium]|nr:hypothetical protein [Burkholderiaceae bacterium]
MSEVPRSLAPWMRCLRAAAAGAAVLAATAGYAAPAAAAPDATASATAQALAARPASKQASITLEGADEPITLLLFEWASAPAPLGFSTYVPSDMIVRAPGAGPAPTLRFVANFGGVLQEQAYLELAPLPAALTPEQAVAAIARSAPAGAPLRRCSGADCRLGWAIAEFDVAAGTKTRGRAAGVVALGRHGDRYFRLTLRHPLEYGSGFGPRADLILNEWRWRDTGAGL